MKLRWDDDHDRCVGCGTRGQDKPHVAEGLCTDCFPATYGDFGLGDVPPAWGAPGASLPPAPGALVAVAKPWHRRWPACLICGRTKHPHATEGSCTGRAGVMYTKRKRGTGVTVRWLPFSRLLPGTYNRTEAKLWTIVRDHEAAMRYLERRASAGGIPTGGKVCIRQTRDADRLPERVIRPVAA
jgi:hypothetical protein